MSNDNGYAFLQDDEPYVIAEVGGNHGGDVEKAKSYVTRAAETGADSVKFQLYQAEKLIQEDEPPLPLAGDNYDTQFERFRELELSRKEWREVINLCESEGIDFSASVFDEEMLDFAADHMPFIKIASGDMTNLPLLRCSAESSKPILLSTGFSSLGEIRSVMSKMSNERVIPLHCVGCYPTSKEDANLSMIEYFRDEFGGPVGYSDHTVGTLAPVAAVAKGARVIEKHFTLDKSQKIGDHRLSANPEEMKNIVEMTSRVHKMHGERRDGEIYQCEGEIRSNMRRSLATKRSIQKGEEINEDALTALRPSDGISPLRLDEVVGRKAKKSINKGELLKESHIR
jgi:sialic acid synthase SpsE